MRPGRSLGEPAALALVQPPAGCLGPPASPGSTSSLGADTGKWKPWLFLSDFWFRSLHNEMVFGSLVTSSSVL